MTSEQTRKHKTTVAPPATKKARDDIIKAET